MTLAVEFAVDAPGRCPVARASEDAASPVTSVARSSTTGAGPVTEEFSAPADAAVGDATDAEAVVSAGAETVYRFERDASEPCVCETIEAVAGPAVDVRAEDGTLVVTVRVEDSATVRSVVERLRDRFGGVRVRSLQNLADAVDAGGRLADDSRLTERQREVVTTAYDMGYFEYPKGANAGEVAEALDISRSTLAEHLAAAQGKLLGPVLDAADVRP